MHPQAAAHQELAAMKISLQKQQQLLLQMRLLLALAAAAAPALQQQPPALCSNACCWMLQRWNIRQRLQLLLLARLQLSLQRL
jgi:hypothetical protein